MLPTARPSLIGVSFLVAVIAFDLLLVDAAPSDRARPLDLPVGAARSGGGGIDPDEEELPESVYFYGRETEADSFFWCLDKSGSMAWQGDFTEQKTEVIAALRGLSETAEFGVVAVSSGAIRFSPTPRRGTAENREAAIEWVRALEPGGESCLTAGVIETLRIANFSRARTVHVFVSSDGAPRCGEVTEWQGAVEAITGANWQRLEIETIHLGSDPNAAAFLYELARRNGGTYRQPPGSR